MKRMQSFVAQIGALIVTLALACGVTSCGQMTSSSSISDDQTNVQAPSSADDLELSPQGVSVEQIRERGKLLVGASGDYCPLCMRESDGSYWGLDVELAQDLADDLGVELVFVPTTWPTILDDAVAGSYDLALCGVSITDARLEKALMSDPYLKNGKTALMRAEDVDKYKTLDDINQPGVRVMENPGGTNEKLAKEWLPNADITIHEANAEIPELIAEGEADVMITETCEAGYYAGRDERLAAPLIDGVLRQGHKMLLAGPSKAGKSYALIELCIAIAEGKPWMGFPCARGRVLYVNLELDRASCLHRFRDVYEALGWRPNSLQNLDIWNLRGRSAPMDKLAPRLIRRALKKDYIAVVIDPIYKVITGDENSADQMAHFCNQFDKVCTELGCAVIYCHHHSKGSQSAKRSMDRASGSGVFARDPDAMLDLIELEISDALREQQETDTVCAICR